MFNHFKKLFLPRPINDACQPGIWFSYLKIVYVFINKIYMFKYDMGLWNSFILLAKTDIYEFNRINP